jgi:hypothetical protein
MSISLIPNKEDFTTLEAIAQHAAESKFFNNLGGKPGIFLIALYAREMGVSPMTAVFGGFVSIQGKITMSAELMNSLIRRAGHKMHIQKCDATECVIAGERADTKETATVSFTIDEARKAGLVKAGGAWDKYAADMLFARCLSRLRRRLFPDVATRAYVEGEIEEEKPKPIEKATVIGCPDIVNVEAEQEALIDRHELNALIEALEGDEGFLQKILAHKKIDSLEKLAKKDFDAILTRVRQYQIYKKSQVQNV